MAMFLSRLIDTPRPGRPNIRSWLLTPLWSAGAVGLSALAGGTAWLAGCSAIEAVVIGSAALAAIVLANGAYQLGRAAYREAAQNRLDSERLKFLMLGSVQAVAIHRDHVPLFVNENYARIFGYESPEQVLKLESLLELASPRDRETLKQRARDRLASMPVPSRFEYEGVRRDGRLIWIETFSIRVPWQNSYAIQSTSIDITERKTAEEALRLSEISHRVLFETNRRILDHSPAGIILLDQNLRIVYENADIRRLLGLAPAQPTGSIGLTLSEAALFRGAPMAALIAKLHQRRKVSLEYAFTNSSGLGFYLSVHVVPILEQERITGAVVLVHDITKRREHEEALRRQDSLLKALAIARSHLVSTEDLERAVNQVLESLGTHLGVDRAMLFAHEGFEGGSPGRAVLGHEWFARGMMPLRASEGATELGYEEQGLSHWLARLAPGQVVTRSAGELPEGERAAFEKIGAKSCIVVPLFRERKLFALLALLDCRRERPWSAAEKEILLAIAESLGHSIERRHAQLRKSENEERLARLTANIPGMFFQYSARTGGSRGFSFVGERGLEILKLDRERLKHDAEPMLSVIHPTDRIVFERLLRDAERTLEPKRWEGRYFRPGGEQRWAQVLMQAFRNARDEVEVDGLLLDITRRKRMELARIETGERELLSAWSDQINSEWRPALQSIEARLSAQPGAAADSGAIREALAIARRLLRQFETAIPAGVSIAPATMLREVIETTLRGTDVAYTLDIAPDVERIAADANAVREILTSLLVLSLQALPEGGELEIEAGNVRSHAQSAGQDIEYFVRIAVRDKRRGVDASWRRSSSAGSAMSARGEGLATVLEWVTQQKGWLTAQANPEKGALFTLYLPATTMALVETALSGPDPGSRDASASGRNKSRS